MIRLFHDAVGGDLELDELIERQVAVEGSHQPIAVGVGEGVAVVPVEVVAAGVGVAGDIHPVARPALAIGRAGEEFVDECIPGGVVRLPGNPLDLFRRGRQTGERVGGAFEPETRLRQRGGFHVEVVSRSGKEGIDRMRARRGWWDFRFRRHVGPMLRRDRRGGHDWQKADDRKNPHDVRG